MGYLVKYKRGIIYGFSHILLSLGVFFINSTVAKMTSVSIYAEYSFIMVMMAYFIFLVDFGTKDYFLATGVVTDKKNKSINDYKTVVNFNLIFIIIFSIAMFLIFESDYLYFYFFFDFISSFLIFKYLLFLYQINSKILLFYKCNITFFVFSILLKIWLIYIYHNIAIPFFISGLVSTFFIILFFKNDLKKNKVNINIDSFKNYIKFILGFNKWMPYTISTLSYLLYLNSDKIIIAKYLGSEQLAYYSIAVIFIAIGEIISGLVWNILLPKVNLIMKNRRLLLILISVAIIGASIYIIFLDIFSPDLISFFFGIKYNIDLINKAVHILSFFFIFRYLNILLELKMIHKGYYQKTMMFRIIAALLNIILNILFINKYGILFAAFTTVVAEMFLTVSITLYLLGKKYKNQSNIMS